VYPSAVTLYAAVDVRGAKAYEPDPGGWSDWMPRDAARGAKRDLSAGRTGAYPVALDRSAGMTFSANRRIPASDGKSTNQPMKWDTPIAA
jgi:hypothetical protein